MSNDMPPVRCRVARLDDLRIDEATAVTAGGREIALFRVESGVYATDNYCTHGAARLCDGYLEGFSIECPLHQGAFDIRSGDAVRAPADEALRTYPVEVDGGDVFVVLTDPDSRV